jgi:hypothetical protein
MKYILLLAALLASIPAFADECLDAGVRFRSFGDTGGGEVYLGVPDLGVASNRVEANFNWNSPGSFPFTFEYDRLGDISVTINGETLGYNGVLFSDINALLVTVASRDQNSTARLEDLVVNSEPISVNNPVDGLVTEAFRIDDVDQGVVTGTIVLDGSFSNSQELSRIEIRVGNDDCDLLPPPTAVPEAVAIPTLSFWSYVFMLAVFAVAGVVYLRR